VILGSQIVGKAFVQAWRQAARSESSDTPPIVFKLTRFLTDARSPASEAAAGGRGGGGNVDAITRNHGMTIDEAANILNVKKAGLVAAEETELQQMLKVRFLPFLPLPLLSCPPVRLRRVGVQDTSVLDCGKP
jgi:import inner membrane translocase subunit TIM16